MNAAQQITQSVPVVLPSSIPAAKPEVLSEREQYLRRVMNRAIAAGLGKVPMDIVELMKTYGPQEVDNMAKLAKSGFKVALTGISLLPAKLSLVKPVKVEKKEEKIPALQPAKRIRKPKAAVAKPAGVGKGISFRQATIAEAIEVLDISRKQADDFIQRSSVTKLAHAVEIARICDPKMAKIISQSKRPFDHIENIFSVKQIECLRGEEYMLAVIKDYCGLVAIP